MSFAAKILSKVKDQSILQEASAVRFCKIGDEVFEMNVDGQSFLLTTDAGLALSFEFAEFLSAMEQRRQ